MMKYVDLHINHHISQIVLLKLESESYEVPNLSGINFDFLSPLV